MCIILVATMLTPVVCIATMVLLHLGAMLMSVACDITSSGFLLL